MSVIEAGAKRIYATLFDVAYLARGLVLYHSLVEHDADMELWVLCLDGDCERILARLALPRLRAVSLAALEASDPELLRVKPQRRRAEYCFTLTPAWVQYVMERTPAEAWVSYADADMRFYSSPQPIFDELASASVGIVPHNFPASQRRMERFGVYNVGLVPFRNDDRARRVLADWRARCIDWCSQVPDGYRYGDQKYLDAWPNDFSGVHVICHPAAGLGPWNWMMYELDVAAHPLRVNGTSLIFYHFQRFRLLNATEYFTGLPHYGKMPGYVRRAIYDPYARDIVRRAFEAQVLPERGRPWVEALRALDVREIARLIRHPGTYTYTP